MFLQINETEARQLERLTRGQADNKKWFAARRWRITASHFGEISKMSTKRDKTKLCKSLISCKKFNTRATLHGKMYERKAVQQYESSFKEKVTMCGLFVRPDWPFLGASPDGVIDKSTIVEVKCPYNGKNEKIMPGKNFKFLEYSKGKIVLKRNSKYFDQIQGQLFISNRNYCIFIVFTFVDLFVQKIKFDSEYCEGCLLPKLHLFYEKHFRPSIAQSL